MTADGVLDGVLAAVPGPALSGDDHDGDHRPHRAARGRSACSLAPLGAGRGCWAVGGPAAARRSRWTSRCAGRVADLRAEPRRRRPAPGSASRSRSRCLVTNAGRRRRARRAARRLGAVGRRDAARPSRSTSRPASGAALTSRADADPPRRPHRGRRHGAVARPAGPGRPAAPAPGAVVACGCCRRSRRASSCRRSWPGCGSSTARWRSTGAARAPSSTRCASTSIGDDVRSIDWRATRPARRRRGPHLAARAGPPGGLRAGHRPHLGRPGRRRPAAGRRARRRPAARRAGRPGRRPGRPARRRPVVRASVEGATRSEVLPTLVQAMAPLEPALVETDARLLVAEVLRRERKRALVVLFTSLDAGADRARACCRCSARLTTRHTVVLAAVGDPRVAELAAPARATPRRSTRRRPPSARWPSGAGSPPSCAAAGSMVVDAPGRRLRLPGRRRLPGAESRRPPLAVPPDPIPAATGGDRRATCATRRRSCREVVQPEESVGELAGPARPDEDVPFGGMITTPAPRPRAARARDRCSPPPARPAGRTPARSRGTAASASSADPDPEPRSAAATVSRRPRSPR